VPFYPVVISILFHRYKELLECEKQINKALMENNNGTSSMTTVVNNVRKEDLQNDYEETEGEEGED
jgi:hypothetical protein